MLVQVRVTVIVVFAVAELASDAVTRQVEMLGVPSATPMLQVGFWAVDELMVGDVPLDVLTRDQAYVYGLLPP